MMTATQAAAIRYASGLHCPTSPATSDGNPNMPLPTMLLTTSAVSVHLPIARTNPADLLRSTYPRRREQAGILLYSAGFAAQECFIAAPVARKANVQSCKEK